MADRSFPARARPRTTAATRVRRWVDGPLRTLALREVRPRDLVRGLLMVLAVVVPCAMWGLATATTQGTLGPHTARYEVTVDAEVTVDLGPLGTVVIDSPVPVLGARVVVQEIPRDVTAVEASATLESLAGDLEDYVRFFSGPQTTVEAAVRGLLADAAVRAGVATGVVTVVLLALRAALGARRRAELAAAVRPHHTAVLAASVAVVLVVGSVTASGPLSAETRPERTASAVFDGTPLEGARITGRLAGVIDTYGGLVVDAYRDNEAFYAAATANVEAAWADRMDHDQQRAAATAALHVPTPDAAPAGERTEEPTGDAAPGPTEGPAEEPTEEPTGDAGGDEENQEETDEPDPEPEPVVMLLITDTHCNVGMAGPVRAVAELAGASVVLNAGDTTVNGSVVESYCVNEFVAAAPDGAQTVAVMGNHDGPATADQLRQAGAHLLEGEVLEVEGIRILGAPDPRATRIGVGTTLSGTATLEEVAAGLAETACADEEGVDLLLVHDPAAGVPTLDAGCAAAQVSGHMHRRQGPLWSGGGARYVSSSTAGAILDQPTIGPLSGVAEMTVLRFDRETGEVLDYRLVQVRPDASASVSAALDWPDAPSRNQPDTPYR